MTEGDHRPAVDAALLLSSLGHAVVAVDPDGVILSWNPAATALYGWTAAEAVGRRLVDVTAGERNEGEAEQVTAAVAAGSSWSGTMRARRRDGSRLVALVTDTGLHADGRLLGVVECAVPVDEVVRPFLERSMDAALILGQGAGIVYATPAAARLFGWRAPEEAAGVDFLGLVHPDDAAIVRSQLDLAAHQPEREDLLECRVCVDGGWRWVEAALAPLPDEHAGRELLCHIRDVTDRREDRERIARLSEELEGALNSRVVIEQAKGVIAATNSVSVDRAFELLRQHARTHRAPLHEVAAAVVTLGLQV